MWFPLLQGVDVVINCAGVFQTVTAKAMWQIHYDGPKLLIEASMQTGVKHFIQLSALGIDLCDVGYATSKRALEDYLDTQNISSTVLRPSFVFGTGCYGGSALFRGLAGLPGILPLPGHGAQLLQPIHINDLAQVVLDVLPLTGKRQLGVAGAEKLSLRTLLNQLRAWLGFRHALNLSIPFILLRMTAMIGNFIPNSPLSSTGVEMMQIDNVLTPSQEKTLAATLSFQPRGFTQCLDTMTSHVQDRWQARLYFLRPCLRLSIAFIWLFSGIISLIGARNHAYPLLQQAGFTPLWQSLTLYGGAGIDILLGGATLFNFRLSWTGTLQCLLMVGYTAILSFILPDLWLDPFASLAKNLPLLAATGVMLAIQDPR